MSCSLDCAPAYEHIFVESGCIAFNSFQTDVCHTNWVQNCSAMSCSFSNDISSYALCQLYLSKWLLSITGHDICIHSIVWYKLPEIPIDAQSCEKIFLLVGHCRYLALRNVVASSHSHTAGIALMRLDI
ncbi:hypothetical protein Tco_1235909 [Tanacetum coccineum]